MEQEQKGMSIASMVLGIVGLVLGWCFYLFIPLGILAIIFGIIGMKKGGRGMAIAGLIMGGLTLLVYLAMVILGLAILAAV
ncbi:MAG: DUF4190 domain-containing protein [Oscillospiraceae bacterium]|nr:DUF4190 domain-containing protein [Oscillospiraceae bacterium]